MSDFFDDNLNINLDGGQVDSPDEFYSGNRVTKEGMYHVTATGASLHKDEGKVPTLQVDMLTLDGTDADGNQLVDQAEKSITHRIFLARWTDKAKTEQGPLEDKQQKGIRAFAYAFGLISEADLGKKDIQIPFHLIEGRQAVVKVSREKDWVDDKGETRTGGLKISWNNDAWPIGHERVKDVHKSREALSMLVGTTGGSSGGGSDLDDI